MRRSIENGATSSANSIKAHCAADGLLSVQATFLFVVLTLGLLVKKNQFFLDAGAGIEQNDGRRFM